mmetsp:Transcript_1319/g.3116  ORF Transcript_1319/g.3116 Transcript_1319/m.3116 type:complete len:213 (+) Transcript_1319:629-1267(+)
MAAPSEVEVPRPSSSSTTSERGVALRSIVAVSDSSTMKVDWPAMMWSRAPMRTKQASIGDRVSSSAGTHAPTCAMMAPRDTWRSSVDLPPMLGPVRSMNGGAPAPPRRMSLGTNTPSRPLMPAGWHRALASNTGRSLRTNLGRQTGVWLAAAAWARLASASSWLAADTAALHSAELSLNCEIMPARMPPMAFSRPSCAASFSLTSSCSSGLM